MIFSEIRRVSFDNINYYGGDTSLLDKYICQIFNSKYEYIGVLIGNSRQEIKEMQKNYKEGE